MLLFGLGLLELAFIALFFLGLVIATAFDRSSPDRGSLEAPKWWILAIGIGVAIAYFWGSFTIASAWETVKTWEFWQPVVIFLGLGLAYSILEFALHVRRVARHVGIRWEQYLSGTESISNTVHIPRRLLISELRSQGGAYQYSQQALEVLRKFLDKSYGNRESDELIELKLDSTLVDFEPRVKREELAEHVGVWTLFWPAYAASLILGDLLTEIFRTLANVLASISGRAVKAAFSGLFKV